MPAAEPDVEEYEGADINANPLLTSALHLPVLHQRVNPQYQSCSGTIAPHAPAYAARPGFYADAHAGQFTVLAPEYRAIVHEQSEPVPEWHSAPSTPGASTPSFG